MNETETYSGVVRRSFFANPDGPAMAGILTLDDASAALVRQRESRTGQRLIDRDQSIRFAGRCFAAAGDRLEVTGQWTKHPRFGDQFTAETGLVKMNESPDALVHLLASSNEFTGLGPVRARQIVDVALAMSEDGTVTDALLRYPTEIAQQANVSVAIVEAAAEAWGAKRNHFEALVQLCSQGWTNGQAARLVEHFGESAAAIVRADPYQLVSKLDRFGFKTVDVVARRMGVTSNDPGRLAAGVAYCLDRAGEDGHTWTSREALITRAEDELRPDTLEAEDLIRQALDGLIALGLVHIDHAPTGEEITASSRTAAKEFELFRRLTAGLLQPADALLSFAGPKAQEFVRTLNLGQRRAIDGLTRRQFSVISGSAGSGKTYLQRAVAIAAQECGLSIAFAAPTGKAARRLQQSVGCRASTVHRLLESTYDEESGGFVFKRNEGYPLDADIVAVDEFSMADVKLALHLVRALKPDARLVLVGDHQQIPSVEAGAVLRDLFSARDRFSESVHVLTEVVRQAGELKRNTTALLDGVVVKNESPEWGFIRTERGDELATENKVASVVEFLVTAPEPLEPFGRFLDLAWDVQVLAPMKKRELGTYALNVHLQRVRQRLLGNRPPEPTPEGKPPRPLVGDRVIWTENDAALDLFNGTQALVVGLPKGGAMELLIEDGREVTIPPAKRSKVEVAWALTIHRSQGSEWPCVLLVASTKHAVMHDRNLIYTGASRASESLTIIGDAPGLRRFANTQRATKRRTFGEFLVQGWEPTLRSPQAVGGPVAENTSAPRD